MYASRDSRRRKVLGSVLYFTFFVRSLLAACGTRSGGAGTGPIVPSATVSPSITVSPFATVTGYGTDQGCPSNVVVSASPTTPDVIVGPTSSVIDTHKGEVIEIHMPFGIMWQGPKTSQGLLQLQNPYGICLEAE